MVCVVLLGACCFRKQSDGNSLSLLQAFICASVSKMCSGDTFLPEDVASCCPCAPLERYICSLCRKVRQPLVNLRSISLHSLFDPLSSMFASCSSNTRIMLSIWSFVLQSQQRKEGSVQSVQLMCSVMVQC